MADYQYVSDGRPAGTVLGNDASDKIGFYGTAPVVQAATITAPATTVASTGVYGYTSTQANAITVGLAAVITALKNNGLIASS